MSQRQAAQAAMPRVRRVYDGAARWLDARVAEVSRHETCVIFRRR